MCWWERLSSEGEVDDAQKEGDNCGVDILEKVRTYKYSFASKTLCINTELAP